MTNHPNQRFIDACYDQAIAGLDAGGIPIGSVLVEGNVIVGAGFNHRVQNNDPTAHGEMDCLKNAGRRSSYRDTVLYTSLSPCMMCSGTIVQFKVPHVVILENSNFGGNEDFLRAHGVKVDVVNDVRARNMMGRFIESNAEVWKEDIAE